MMVNFGMRKRRESFFVSGGFLLLVTLTPLEVLRQTTYVFLFFLVVNNLKDEKGISNICGDIIMPLCYIKSERIYCRHLQANTKCN